MELSLASSAKLPVVHPTLVHTTSQPHCYPPRLVTISSVCWHQAPYSLITPGSDDSLPHSHYLPPWRLSEFQTSNRQQSHAYLGTPREERESLEKNRHHRFLPALEFALQMLGNQVVINERRQTFRHRRDSKRHQLHRRLRSRTTISAVFGSQVIASHSFEDIHCRDIRDLISPNSTQTIRHTRTLNYLSSDWMDEYRARGFTSSQRHVVSSLPHAVHPRHPVRSRR